MTAPLADERTSLVEDVKVELPANDRFLRIARLAAAGLADEAGFDVDGVEDLRVAVDEAAVALIEVASPSATVVLQFRVSPGRVDFFGEVPADKAPSLHPVAESVLDVLTQGMELDHGRGCGSIRFTVRQADGSQVD